MARQKKYDRAAEDVGNIVSLEHVNVLVPDQQVATTFYISGLGLTRDPFMMTGGDIMWVNIGRSQFHLPTRGTQVLRGHTGLVIQDYARLPDRLKTVRPDLKGTKFSYRRGKDWIDVTCPWGNRYRCFPPDGRLGAIAHGMPYVCFDVPKGTADGIARFYADIIGAPSVVERFNGARAAQISAGPDQKLIFRETSAKPAKFDGHHVQVYIADFSSPHRALLERGLVTEESDEHQYRFEGIVDPDSGEHLFTIEHEVRSLHHPLYARPLVNRNPGQRIMTYQPGDDALDVG